jgi:uncharacterized membrane protein YgcG
MKTTIYMRFFGALLAIAAVGCNYDSGITELDGSNTYDGHIESIGLKVSLEDATFEQVAPYVSECRGNKLCVQICHRPPGNPDNSKTMLLPLQATAAHLHHGGAHHERDYLGACDDLGEDNQGGDAEGGGSEGGGSEGGGSEGGGSEGGGSEIPLWCQPYVSIDANCDGYIDESGEPLF